MGTTFYLYEMDNNRGWVIYSSSYETFSDAMAAVKDRSRMARTSYICVTGDRVCAEWDHEYLRRVIWSNDDFHPASKGFGEKPG